MHNAPSEAIELKLSWTEVPKSPFMVWALFVSIGDGGGGRGKVSRGGGGTGDGVTVAVVAAVESKAVVVADAVADSDIFSVASLFLPLSCRCLLFSCCSSSFLC